ncbi:MAG TPA: type I glyceraldehyde-3-phosphate dehydrogenase [Pseudonocardiaceae bacterium]
MATRVGINGFGRVGRDFLRRALAQDLDVVAINDLTDTATLAHLLRYDSVHGPLPQPIEHDADTLLLGGHEIAVTARRDPATLDWRTPGVHIVLESTGQVRDRDDARLHLQAGARKVLLSAPGTGADLTVVMGVSHFGYDPHRHDVLSAASCTTHCVLPMVSVLHEQFGVRSGFLTTVHAYTHAQPLLDSPHPDLRRARAAATSIIPTSAGTARAASQVIDELARRLDRLAPRVPVENASLTDLTAVLDRDTTVEEVNTAFHRAARQQLTGILRCENDPVVSRDILGDPSSCVFDVGLTQADGNVVKTFGWYDNQYGYSCRLVDLCRYVADRL